MKNAFTGEELKRGEKQVRNDDAQAKVWYSSRVVLEAHNHQRTNKVDCSNLPSKADPSQVAECDVNNILKRYARTGVLPGVNVQSVYADVSTSGDYQHSLDLVINAQQQFDSLDAHTRKRFGNDPAEFLAFVEDPKNGEALIKMGLATRPLPSDTDRIINELRKSHEEVTPLASSPAAGSRSSKKKPDDT